MKHMRKGSMIYILTRAFSVSTENIVYMYTYSRLLYIIGTSLLPFCTTCRTSQIMTLELIEYSMGI